MLPSKLPSQNPDSREDRAYERGFIFGRSAAISAVRDGIAKGYSLDELEQFLTELSNVEFSRL